MRISDPKFLDRRAPGLQGVAGWVDPSVSPSNQLMPKPSCFGLVDFLFPNQRIFFPVRFYVLDVFTQLCSVRNPIFPSPQQMAVPDDEPCIHSQTQISHFHFIDL